MFLDHQVCLDLPECFFFRSLVIISEVFESVNFGAPILTSAVTILILLAIVAILSYVPLRGAKDPPPLNLN